MRLSLVLLALVPLAFASIDDDDKRSRRLHSKPAPKPALKVVGQCYGKPQKPQNYKLCGLCEGDCDYDWDCKPGYKCYQRNAYKPVPYCSGGDKDGSRTDYCTKPW